MSSKKMIPTTMRELLDEELGQVAGGGPHISHCSHMSHLSHQNAPQPDPTPTPTPTPDAGGGC